MANDGVMTGNGWTDDFKNWAVHPFSADMSLLHWFYLIGAILIFVILWRLLLAHLFRAIAEI